MKNIFVITLLSFVIFSCSNSESNNNTEGKTTAAQTSTHDDHAGHDHAGHSHDEPKHHTASPLSQYMGIWFYAAATHKRDYYKDRWIEFKGDGTFENGVGGKQTNSGTWSLEENSKYINFDFKDNSVEEDEQWKVQLNPPVLLLLGNAPRNTSGAQIKLNKVEERPKG